jgi:hypothetical protein
MHKKEYIRPPLGIIILIIVTFIDILRATYSYFTQNSLFFGIHTTGISFYIVNSIMVLLSVFVIFSFVSLSKKYFYPIISYFVLMIINHIATIINYKFLALSSNTNPLEIIFIHSLGILLFLVTIWYIFEKKTLFFTKKDDNKAIEAVFAVIYIFFFVIMTILSIYL